MRLTKKHFLAALFLVKVTLNSTSGTAKSGLPLFKYKTYCNEKVCIDSSNCTASGKFAAYRVYHYVPYAFEPLTEYETYKK